ncbi:ABC transporter ATP-binding protein [Plantibacter sp. Mn2098]|uniref:ABC transporter ATP-binding protein n=1 Tax=Plantibacter sp. Mn2098 TaxID=3395266 RepID=UPI003BD51B18
MSGIDVGGTGTEAAQLRASGITVTTERGRRVLVDDVGFSVRAGRCVGIVGESGSGKSVLLRSVIGLLPDGLRLRSGEVSLDGAALGRRSGSAADPRRAIGLVLQDPGAALDPIMTIGAQLSQVRRVLVGSGKRAAAEEAVELLDRVRLREPGRVAGQYPHELSGGMRQRASIALALAAGPRFLLCDEPTTALDVTVQRRVLELLHTLSVEEGLGIVFVSHDLPVIAEISDDMIVMRHGRVVESGPTGRLVDAPESDYLQELVAEARALANGGDRDR